MGEIARDLAEFCVDLRWFSISRVLSRAAIYLGYISQYISSKEQI